SPCLRFSWPVGYRHWRERQERPCAIRTLKGTLVEGTRVINAAPPFATPRRDQGEECDGWEPRHRCTRGDPTLRHSGAFAFASCLHHSISGFGSRGMGAVGAGVIAGGVSVASGSSGVTAMGGAALR